MKMKELSVIIPIFNDAEVLCALYARLQPVLSNITQNYEIVFVDDGSEDDSPEIIKELQSADYRIKLVILARNFGQSNAIAAGLSVSKGDLIVIMDSDLEDRPEDIPKLLAAMEENNIEMAIAQKDRINDSWQRRGISKLFFLFSHAITNIKHQQNLGVFRVIKRRAYQRVISTPNLHGTILSRFYLADISYCVVPVMKDQRFAGKSGYDLAKKIRLAADRILPNLRFKSFQINRDPDFVIKEIIKIRETR